MSTSNSPHRTRASSLWHLVEAMQRATSSGGFPKKVTLTAYFDESGRCVGREQIEVVKIFPNGVFEKLNLPSELQWDKVNGDGPQY